MGSSSMRIGAFPDMEPITQTWTNQALWEAVHARKSEYTLTRKARVEIGTWNVAFLKGTEDDLGSWFAKNKDAAQGHASSNHSFRNGEGSGTAVNSLSARSIAEDNGGSDRQERIREAGAIQQRLGSVSTEDDIDIYVLGLQEIVDINSPTEALRPFVDPGPSQKWKRALKEALPEGYELIAEQQLVGLLILIAVAPSMTSLVSSVSTTSVGTGMLGYMGNKGAVAVRLVLGELTRLVFINCHLAAGSEPASLDRRNWDAGQITQKIKFDPVPDEAGAERAECERIGDEDFAWWFGDLNYRLEGLSSDDVRRILMLHMRDEFDVPGPVGPGIKYESSKHTYSEYEPASQHQSHRETSLEHDYNLTPHPASLVTTLTSFLPHDQLRIQQLAKKAFHEGWREGLIAFLPTYKYDVGSTGTFDSSEKKRGPSWCDRILFRTCRDFLRYKEDVHRFEKDKKAKEESKGSRTDLDKDEDLIYNYDPETDGALDEDKDYESKNSASTLKSDYDLHLATYTSHQHVSSSDHKPVVALFDISFEVADTELKKKLYAEVARQYDKLENEGRPDLTVLVERESNKEWNSSERDSQNAAGENLVDFGEVCYGQEKRRVITLANTGRVPARFALMQAVDGVDATPTWLTCSGESDRSEGDTEWHHSYKGVLLPGESAAIVFRLCVEDVDLIRVLNQGKNSLEHVLILRVVNGRDHFIPVEGVWMQSIFGRSLDELVRLPEGGVREAQTQSPRDGKNSRPRGSGSAPPALVELTSDIGYLVPRVILAWNTKEGDSVALPPWEGDMSWPFSDRSWTLSDDQSRKQLNGYVYEALDNNKSARSLFPPNISFLEQLEILGEVLITFITTLEDGIVTEKLWATIEQEMANREKNKNPPVNDEEEVARIFEILSTSPIHSVSFVFLTSMLSQISTEIISSVTQNSTPAIIHPVVPPNSPSATTTGLESSQITRKRLVNREYAEVFSKIVIRCSMPSREKDKRAVNERRSQLMQLFLNTE